MQYMQHRMPTIRTVLPFCSVASPVRAASRPRPLFKPVMAAPTAVPAADPNNYDDDVLQRIQQQFEHRAAAYDTDRGYHSSLAQCLLQLCALQPGESLLDLAAGTGLVGLEAAQSAVGSSGRVVLVDVSPAMLQQARSKHAAMLQQSRHVAATGEHANYPSAASAGPQQQLQQQQDDVCSDVHFITGDMEQLSSCLLPAWQPGSFDAITCSAAAPFLRHPTVSLAAWRQWLKQPGGRLCLNVFVPPALEDFGTFQRLAAAAGVPVFDPCEPLGSAELVTAALEAGGYSRVQVSPETKQRWMPAVSVEAYAQGIWLTALTRNPFMPPGLIEGSLSSDALEGLRQQFIAAVVDDVETRGRLDASGQRVLNTYTVLHVLARS